MQSELVGTWKLASASMQDVGTGEKLALWGQRPNGYLVITADCRWLVIQTAEVRKHPASDQDRVAAFRSMLAYSGKFRVEGKTIIILVDIAWDETWIGTEQARLYRIEEDKLYIEALPQIYENLGGKLLRGLLIWEKAC